LTVPADLLEIRVELEGAGETYNKANTGLKKETAQLSRVLTRNVNLMDSADLSMPRILENSNTVSIKPHLEQSVPGQWPTNPFEHEEITISRVRLGRSVRIMAHNHPGLPVLLLALEKLQVPVNLVRWHLKESSPAYESVRREAMRRAQRAGEAQAEEMGLGVLKCVRIEDLPDMETLERTHVDGQVTVRSHVKVTFISLG
jgi:hypothetical protein